MRTEESLLNDVKGGNPAAQRELYERYAGQAMTVCVRYISDREAVRDVMQDAFVKVFTTISRFNYRGEGSLKAWIMRIAANESLNYLRKQGHMPTTDNLPELPDDDVEKPDIGQVPIQELLRMIATLPVGYRTVFNLYVFEQMTHKQIAHTLGIKESSSASQYLRAKRMLAKQINHFIKQQQ